MLGNDTLPRRPRSSRSLVVTDADAVDEDTATTDTIAGTAQQNLVAGFDQYRTMAETTATTQSADDVVPPSTYTSGGTSSGSKSGGSHRLNNSNSRSGSTGRRSPTNPKSLLDRSRGKKSKSPPPPRRRISKSPSNASSSQGSSSVGQKQPQHHQHPMRSPRSSKYKRSPPLQKSPAGYRSPTSIKSSPGGFSPSRIKGSNGWDLPLDAKIRLDRSFPDLAGTGILAGGNGTPQNSKPDNNNNHIASFLSGGIPATTNKVSIKKSSSNNQLERSKHTATPQYPVSSDDELPALVDDSIVREGFEGYRGGKQWNIREDTPGGHIAPENFVIVPAIEDSDIEDDKTDDDYECCLEEDEDIVDDSLLMGSNIKPKRLDINRTQQSLPDDIPTHTAAEATVPTKTTDGGKRHLSAHIQSGVQDRFDPSFKNSDMWTTDDEQEAKLTRSHSGSVSILSDRMEDVDDLALDSSGHIDDHQTCKTSSTGGEVSAPNNKRDGGDVSMSKTPATTKRSGRRRYSAGNMQGLPNLSSSLRSNNQKQNDGDPDDSIEYGTSVLESAQANSSKKKPRRKKKSKSLTSASSAKHSSRTGAHTSPKHIHDAARGNNSGSSSSNRRSAHTNSGSKSRTAPGMERNLIRNPRGGRKIPDVVPATPSQSNHSWLRCSPMSSSLTSTPSSTLNSSAMQQRQLNSLQHLRRKKKKNKSLNAHVGREQPFNPPTYDTDDHTLGASTITTNFSATYRTRGDNTVSSRSLFRSDKMSHSDALKVPQRRKEADSDYELSDAEDQSSSHIDEVDEMHGSAEICTQAIAEILDGKIPPPENAFKTLLRRPSGDLDNLHDAFDLIISDGEEKEGSARDDDGADDGSNASDFVRWQKENGNLISPGGLDKKIEPGEHAFLELNIDDVALHVENKKVTEVTQVLATTPPSSFSPSGADMTNNSVALEKLDEDAKVEGKETAPMRQKNGEVLCAPDSPSEQHGKKKKKAKGGRFGLFKRVQSWKGAMALKDDEA